ncbi:pyridoxal-phosphate dependent enzyme [Actinoplanes sp. NPDC023936]|uniref:pyridoxal-phosphate dependent enzyme n=1 Tax=Actinoplanes sp. NPDC023936 TaxID=3154910 RepID=UPI0033F7BDC1
MDARQPGRRRARGAVPGLRPEVGRRPDGPVTLVTATDGNHGRAVAHFAKQFGHRAEIYVPDGVHPDAVQAIRDEGATVTHVPGDYDDAVQSRCRRARAGRRRGRHGPVRGSVIGRAARPAPGRLSASAPGDHCPSADHRGVRREPELTGL